MRTAKRKAELINKVADHMLAHGLSASSLRALAQSAGTSDRMLLYYFADRNDIVTAAIECIAGRMVDFLETHGPRPPRDAEVVRREIAAVVLSDALWPYMRIWLELATMAAHGEEIYRTVGAAIGRDFLAWGAAQIDAPNEAAREREAARLLASIEGLVLLRALGLNDICAQAVR